MKIYLVRHGNAVKRSSWTEDDELRPLSPKGEDQARGIQAVLQKVPLRAIYSSPAVRCRETVEGLAADRTLSVELDPRLGEGASVEGVLDLLAAEGRAPVVICASRKLIVDLLWALGVGRDDRGAVRCRKGSIWALERKRRRVVSAEYVPPLRVAPHSDPVARWGVLDVGSTSMSLLVADVWPRESRIEPVLRMREELRVRSKAGGIREVDREHVLETGRILRAQAESVGSQELVPVATASLRDAENGVEVATRLGSVLAVPVRLLSGEEEARTVYRAIRVRLGLGERAMLALDLGGGSLALALGRGDRIVYEASEPLGVTRLHAELVRSDPMNGAEVDAIRDRVVSCLAPHRKIIAGAAPARCVAAGGAVRALARLARAKKGRADTEGLRGDSVPRAQLAALAVKLRRTVHRERLEMPSVGARWADLLPTAAIILESLLEELGLKSLVVSDWGLREGILLERMRSLSVDRADPADPVDRAD